MNSKYLATLLIVFGLLFTFAQCRQLALRDQGDDDDDNSGGDGGDSGEDTASLDEEKRAIFNYLQDEQGASQFLDRSRRLFGDQKSHMKEAKKGYEEKCERLFHPRYCPDLATWPAWNQAFNSASGKK